MGVNPCRRLIKQNDRWVANQRDCTLELALVATRKLPSLSVCVISEVHLFYLTINKLFPVVFANAFYRRIELQVLANSKGLEERVELWTVTHQTASFIETAKGPNVVAAHEQLAGVWCLLTCQAFKCGCLARACDSK